MADDPKKVERRRKLRVKEIKGILANLKRQYVRLTFLWPLYMARVARQGIYEVTGILIKGPHKIVNPELHGETPFDAVRIEPDRRFDDAGHTWTIAVDSIESAAKVQTKKPGRRK